MRRVEARVRKSGKSGGSKSGESVRRGSDEPGVFFQTPPEGFGRKRAAHGARFAFAPPRAAAAGAHARVKRTITHVFHPVYPFAMSVSQAFMQPQVVSFHLRWDGDSE